MNNNKEITTKQRVIVIKDIFREQNNNKIKEFNGYHAIAYAGSQLFYNPIRGNMWFSTNQLFQIMGNNDSRAKSKINSAIRDLIKWDMLEAENFNGKNGNNDVLSLKIPHIDKKESKFTTINYDFVLRIIESDQPITEKGNMLLIYMVLAQYMGNDVIAYPSIETMANDSGLSSSTISNTLHNLKELKIIEYGNNGLYKNTDGKIRSSNNIYIFMDIEGVEKVIKHHIKNKKEKDDKAKEEIVEEEIIINDNEPEEEFIDYTQIEDIEPTKEEIIDSLFG